MGQVQLSAGWAGGGEGVKLSLCVIVDASLPGDSKEGV